MKRIAMTLLGLLLVIVGILLAKTFSRSARVFAPLPAGGLPAVDADRAAQLLAGAVRFRTIAERDPNEMRHSEFTRFRAYLRSRFPRVHRNLRLQLFERHTMVLTWSGRNTSAAPVVLMGHYDVVPISEETKDAWQVAPFAGLVKDGYIWGRGTLDDKLTVVGLLNAAELLLDSGFQPDRTIYLVFGHDEEVLGTGAQAVVAWMKAEQIRPEFVMDEGGTILTGAVPGVKAPVALIGTTEKGYLTLKLSAQTEAGHSMMPPKNTAVGLVARAVARVEGNPMPTRIDGALRDFFRHTGPHMPFVLRMAVANLWLLEPVVIAELGASRAGNATVRTTTAPTIIRGGVKENVLPDRAEALINFRILPSDSVESVTEHVRRVIDDERIQLEAVTVSQPSPVTSPDSKSFELLGRAVATIFPDALVSPYLMIGATDSRHFAAISDNVMRFIPVRLHNDELGRIHGVNERVAVKDYADIVRFKMLLLKQL